jgi:hypothetical protein
MRDLRIVGACEWHANDTYPLPLRRAYRAATTKSIWYSSRRSLEARTSKAKLHGTMLALVREARPQSLHGTEEVELSFVLVRAFSIRTGQLARSGVE